MIVQKAGQKETLKNSAMIIDGPIQAHSSLMVGNIGATNLVKTVKRTRTAVERTNVTNIP